ncbi:hypothetical protein FB451DRAFT_1185958 [Mycena latifolia]|nr:hypothetical protein FB451DRAFT_1185958 [Mycena latifolia]
MKRVKKKRYGSEVFESNRKGSTSAEALNTASAKEAEVVCLSQEWTARCGTHLGVRVNKYAELRGERAICYTTTRAQMTKMQCDAEVECKEASGGMMAMATYRRNKRSEAAGSRVGSNEKRKGSTNCIRTREEPSRVDRREVQQPTARARVQKREEGKGGVRGIRKVKSGSGDDEEIKQGEGSMDDEGPDEGESDHEQRRGLKAATYGSGAKAVQIEGQGTRAIALSAAWIPMTRRWSGTETGASRSASVQSREAQAQREAKVRDVEQAAYIRARCTHTAAGGTAHVRLRDAQGARVVIVPRGIGRGRIPARGAAREKARIRTGCVKHRLREVRQREMQMDSGVEPRRAAQGTNACGDTADNQVSFAIWVAIVIEPTPELSFVKSGPPSPFSRLSNFSATTTQPRVWRHFVFKYDKESFDHFLNLRGFFKKEMSTGSMTAASTSIGSRVPGASRTPRVAARPHGRTPCSTRVSQRRCENSPLVPEWVGGRTHGSTASTPVASRGEGRAKLDSWSIARSGKMRGDGKERTLP